MKLNVQKRLAASVLRASEKRVWFDPQRLTEVKEAITKHDIANLINKGAIGIRPKVGVSRGRARKIKVQKSKGRRKGQGSRGGKFTARSPAKESWMNRIRLQREFLAELKEKKLISLATYRDIYGKAKGGFFRSRRHVKIYLTDNDLFEKKK
jgi:large subunit ribosomal protein L19e